MGQRERNDALQALRDGHAKVCVATDVAARGLDLPDLGLVIHADLPSNKATLLHRSGRTGRAGKKGTSVLLVTHAKRRRTEQVLASANIEATWSGPPTADEIRAQDRQRLLEHPALSATINEDDQQLAKQLAERMPAEQLAGALLGLLRADYPEPEDVSDDGRMRNAQNLERQSGERHAPRTRAERGFTASEGDGVWFRLNVGRERNADPKWILPLLCRVGNITRNEIGPIRIFANETKVEIAGHAAEGFAQSIQTMTETQVQIEPSAPPNASDNVHPARARREDGQRADRAPREKRDFGDRPPRAKRDFGDRPPREPRTDFKRSGREEARAARHQQRDREQAKLAADPVYAALAPSELQQHKGPPPAHPSGLNRKQRRDAARAAGEIAPVTAEPAKRSWSPEADSRPQRTERRERPQHADARHAERRARDEQRGPNASEGFKPRGPKGAKPFKPRGDKPFGGKSFGGKPGGKFKDRPAGKRDWRG